MSEKATLPGREQEASQSLLDKPRPVHTRGQRRYESRFIGHWLPAALLLCAIGLLFRQVFMCHGKYDSSKGLRNPESEAWVIVDEDDTKVELEAHIMSKCPDARDCLRELVVPAMEQISEQVKFKLSYIGSYDPDSDAVSCMHGPGECLGNIIQLCAARIYPDPKIFLGFSTCMTSSYSRIPDRDLIEGCAFEHGIEFDRLNKCISDEGHGTDLLRDSIQRSKDNNVTKSCTVRLNNEIRCIRDGGKWYDCPGGSTVDDLVRDVKAFYDMNR